jgi:hypothetical protein
LNERVLSGDIVKDLFLVGPYTTRGPGGVPKKLSRVFDVTVNVG